MESISRLYHAYIRHVARREMRYESSPSAIRCYLWPMLCTIAESTTLAALLTALSLALAHLGLNAIALALASGIIIGYLGWRISGDVRYEKELMWSDSDDIELAHYLNGGVI